MSDRNGAVRAAAAVNQRAKDVHDWKSHPVELAIVRENTPDIKVEMFDGAHVLVEGETLQVSQFLRWWDANYTIQVGDVLLLMHLDTHDYLAFDVRTSRPVRAGIRPSKPPTVDGADMTGAEASSTSGILTASGGIAITWHRNIGHKLRVYDKDGTLIGYVPVFDDLP